ELFVVVEEEEAHGRIGLYRLRAADASDMNVRKSSVAPTSHRADHPQHAVRFVLARRHSMRQGIRIVAVIASSLVVSGLLVTSTGPALGETSSVDGREGLTRGVQGGGPPL